MRLELLSSPVFLQTVLLLTVSNLFMLTAWYFHLKSLGSSHWFVAAIVSWSIAFFEYMVHIPANRIGYQEMTLAQLQILQISMSLVLFIPFAILVMDARLKLDYLWAALCLIGAAYFIFRNGA